MKKLTRPVQRVNAPVLGLDIRKDMIAYSFFSRADDELECGEISSSAQGLWRPSSLILCRSPSAATQIR